MYRLCRKHPAPILRAEETKMPEEQRPYHHGNLVPTLIETTIQLIEEMGVEKVTVREVAKRSVSRPARPSGISNRNRRC